MKSGMFKRFSFIGKSMLWSLCLYMIFMMAANWSDVKNTVAGNGVTIVLNDGQQAQGFFTKPTIIPNNVSTHVSVVKNVVTLVKAVCGISGILGK